MGLTVTWTQAASRQLEDLCAYIRKDSYANAESVKMTIILAVENLAFHPKDTLKIKRRLTTMGTTAHLIARATEYPIEYERKEFS